jgi:hypothetical protein
VISHRYGADGRIAAMLKRPWVIVVLSPLAFILGWITFCELFCPTGTLFEFKCRYCISIGMTMDEAESILGRADEEHAPPCLRSTGSVVSGDQYFVWQGEAADLHVGVKDGKICSKWIEIPSL